MSLSSSSENEPHKTGLNKPSPGKMCTESCSLLVYHRSLTCWSQQISNPFPGCHIMWQSLSGLIDWWIDWLMIDWERHIWVTIIQRPCPPQVLLVPSSALPLWRAQAWWQIPVFKLSSSCILIVKCMVSKTLFKKFLNSGPGLFIGHIEGFFKSWEICREIYISDCRTPRSYLRVYMLD